MERSATSASRMLAWTAQALEKSSIKAARLGNAVAQRAAGQTPAIAPVAPSRSMPVALPQKTLAQDHFKLALQSVLDESVNASKIISLIAIRIDHFDVVTASHGIPAGEEVLEIATGLICETVRSEDFLTRRGIDGFTLLWAPDNATPSAEEIAERIAAKFDQPLQTLVGRLPITVSAGIASTGPGQERVSAGTMQRQAHTAVTNAMQTGRAKLVQFDPALESRAIKRYETERHLRTAVRNNGLSVAYQPIVSLHSGEVLGIEALARWSDASLGNIGPATFIPLAEDSGLIGELGQMITRQAIHQGSEWNRQQQNPLMITINLSNRQLLDPTLIPSLESLLQQHQLAPNQLCLEITESVVMSNVAASMTILGHMKDLGLCLAIDDFGTGYSSLSYLRRLPVDILKIDRSFVQSVYNRDDRVITKAIIDLAHTLGMTTIAEGVETQLQVEVLHALDCDMAQGFLLHPPTPAEQVNFSPIDFANYPEEIGTASVISGSHDSLSVRSRPAG